MLGWLVEGAPAGTVEPAGRADGVRPPMGEQTGRPSPQAPLPAARVWTVLTHPWTIGFALLGALADIDFLFGNHSGQTHSVGAMAIVFLVAALWGGRLDVRRGLACSLAYGSHVLFDWLGNDTTPPIGIMALWPFTDAFYQSDLSVFDAISRRYWLANFWTHNALAVVREIALVAPLAWVVWRIRRRGVNAAGATGAASRAGSARGA